MPETYEDLQPKSSGGKMSNTNTTVNPMTPEQAGAVADRVLDWLADEGAQGYSQIKLTGVITNALSGVPPTRPLSYSEEAQNGTSK